MSLEEVAGLVCNTLAQHDLRAVLSGDAVASIYSSDEIGGYDLSFSIAARLQDIDPPMTSLGFLRQQNHWRHTRSPYWITFLPGPFTLGGQPIHLFAKRETSAGVLHLLRPTECVMEQLDAYIRHSNPRWLTTAVRIASHHGVDPLSIEPWARRAAPQGATCFDEFERHLREYLDKDGHDRCR